MPGAKHNEMMTKTVESFNFLGFETHTEVPWDFTGFSPILGKKIKSYRIDVVANLNPATKAQSHIPARDWLVTLKGLYKGVIFDPPYSLRQVKECYNSIGLEMDYADSVHFPIDIKNLISPRIMIDGLAVCCGWNSSGIGRRRGFELIEILLVCHGAKRNDTIVTVERKVQNDVKEWT